MPTSKTEVHLPGCSCALEGQTVLPQVEPEGHPLFLDCLVPSLVRLADVEYSVFAKGTHCQWHAKVVTCLAASVGHFLDPHSISEEYRTTVRAARNKEGF